MKRILKIILIIVVLCVVLQKGEHMVMWLVSSEYRELKKFSDIQSKKVDANLRASLANYPKKILIKDLTPFKWEQVCVFHKDSYPRQDARHPKNLNKNYPVLAGFGKSSESGLMFIEHNRIVAVIPSSDMDIQYATKFCAEYDNAKLIPFPRGERFKGPQNGIFYRERSLESIKPLGRCDSTTLCSYVFTEK